MGHGTAHELSGGRRDPLVRTKRRAYLCACLLGVPVDALGWLRLSEDPAIAASYGAITIVLVICAVVVVSPLRLAIAERVAFYAITAAFLGRLAVVLYLTPDVGVEFGELITSLVILCCVYLLAFLVFPRLVALPVALAVLAGSGLLILGAFLRAPAELPHDGMPLLKAFTMQAILVALLYILAVTKEEMSASQAREQALAELASTDPLTGVPNRRHLTAALERHVADAARSGRPLSVVLIDIDNFKGINDTQGHEVGDRVLCHVAETLEQELRTADTFGRWGGEEFLVVAVGTDLADAERLAARCRSRLHAHPSPDAGLVTSSFGVATYHRGDRWDALLSSADRALYEAKHGGRDQVATDRVRQPA